MKRAMIVAVVAAAVCGASAVMGMRAGEPPASQQETPAMNEEARQQAEQMTAMNAPREEHKLLESMCGEFDVTMTIYPMPGSEPMTIKATAAREMILGGKFMRETVESTDAAMPFTTLCHTGFNADAKGGGRFEVVRMSTSGHCMMPERGTFDEATRTFNLEGTHEINGMTGSVRVVHRLLDEGKESADVYLAFEAYAEHFNGMKVPEYKAMVLEYQRK